jgi:hypothetical protein
MKFVLEVDLAAGAVAGNEIEELGRILRYWAGNLKYYDVEPGVSEALRDSAYFEVGAWRFEA